MSHIARLFFNPLPHQRAKQEKKGTGETPLWVEIAVMKWSLRDQSSDTLPAQMKNRVEWQRKPALCANQELSSVMMQG